MSHDLNWIRIDVLKLLLHVMQCSIMSWNTSRENCLCSIPTEVIEYMQCYWLKHAKIMSEFVFSMNLFETIFSCQFLVSWMNSVALIGLI